MTQKTLWEEDLADLKTPKHDEIVLGLTKEKIMSEIWARKLNPEITFYNQFGDIDKYPFSGWFPCWGQGYYKDEEGQKICSGKLSPMGKHDHHPDGYYYDWEMVKVNEHMISIQKDEYKDKKNEWREWAKKIKQKFAAPVIESKPELYELEIKHEVVFSKIYGGSGTFDVVATLTQKQIEQSNEAGIKFNAERKAVRFCFEVKTSIPSYGELMRQVNHYRTFTQLNEQNRIPSIWFVVSPDARFKDAIESQGVHFWKW